MNSKTQEMISHCPSCLASRKVELIDSEKNIDIRGESFRVAERVYRCATCGTEFFTPAIMVDSLDLAYRAYRKKHGWLQPEEIKAFRNRHQLSQKDLGALLGFGQVTLSRYENGSLQDKAHEVSMRNFITLIERFGMRPDQLSIDRDHPLAL
jgi:putative zinc finger/helix-turn-helix YgiT family protein